ncbi:dienelactone hydrolase family protein, partial [Rubripirellula amarantea]|nr:dienelactone hydrolase family protein [Rubripirellula amarantea]
MHSKRSRFLLHCSLGTFISFALTLVTCCTAFGQGPETLPALVDGQPPQNWDELWSGFDASAEPLQVEVIQEWEEEGVVLRIVRFRVGLFKGQPATLAAVYGFPRRSDPDQKFPGLVQIHGGGQYADHKACLMNGKRGYATVSLAWAGRISAPDYRVGPSEVKLFWDKKTDNPNYKLTTDWGAVDGYHAPGRNAGNHFPNISPKAWTLDTVDSPRNSGWFLTALAARRALTFLEQQPEVDRDRLGVYGHSMGGKLTVLTATDPRVKAAAPSCGGISDRDNASDLFQSTLGDDASLEKITCPIIFLSPANDFHGRIGDLPKAIDEIRTDQWRVTCSPHHNHQDTSEYEVASLLWFDQHLQHRFQFPSTPITSVQLKTANGTPMCTIHPDVSQEVQSVDVYYTQHGKPEETSADRQNTVTRFWRHAAAKALDGEWSAELPLASVDKPLWVFANVVYGLDEPVSGAGYYYRIYTTDRFNVSSLIEKISPEDLRSAGLKASPGKASPGNESPGNESLGNESFGKASLQRTNMIETFEPGWTKEWFSYRPAQWPRSTHKLRDQSHQAPEQASLALQVRSEESNQLVISLDQHAAVVEIASGDKWNEVVLTLQDFTDCSGDPLKSWNDVHELRLSDTERLMPAAGIDRSPKIVGKRWIGTAPEFRNLRWIDTHVTDAASKR